MRYRNIHLLILIGLVITMFGLAFWSYSYARDHSNYQNQPTFYGLIAASLVCIVAIIGTIISDRKLNNELNDAISRANWRQ